MESGILETLSAAAVTCTTKACATIVGLAFAPFGSGGAAIIDVSRSSRSYHLVVQRGVASGKFWEGRARKKEGGRRVRPSESGRRQLTSIVYFKWRRGPCVTIGVMLEVERSPRNIS